MLTRRGFLGGLGMLALNGCGIYFPKIELKAGSDKTFVFNNGFLQDADELNDYSNFFSDRNYGTLRWSYPERNSVKGLSEELRKIVVESGIDKPVLFGCSMGGIVSMQYAVDYPEDYSGLVLISSGNKVREDNPLGRGEIFFGLKGELFRDVLNFYVEPSNIDRPVLHFYGNRDEFFSNESVDESLTGLSGRYRRVVFENEGHDITTKKSGEIIQFLNQNLDIFQE